MVLLQAFGAVQGTMYAMQNLLTQELLRQIVNIDVEVLLNWLWHFAAVWKFTPGG
jgi:hypothetical protein